MKIYSLITFAFLLIHSCKKDRGIVNIESGAFCTEVPDSISSFIPSDPPPPFGQTYNYHFPGYHSPCFNPNNSNEFVYVKTIHDVSSIAQNAPIDALVIYNLTSKKSIVLNENIRIENTPFWSTNGWIYYGAGGTRMRVNPESLENEVISSSYFLGQCVSPNGEYIALDFYILNSEGISVDTLPTCVSNNPRWADDGWIYGIGGGGRAIKRMRMGCDTISSISIPMLQQFDISNLANNGHSAGIREVIPIANSGKFLILLSRFGGIWMYDDSDKSCSEVKEGGYDCFFYGIDADHEAKKIIAGFRRENPLDPIRSSFNVYENIYLMDINGCNMEEVVLE